MVVALIDGDTVAHAAAAQSGDQPRIAAGMVRKYQREVGAGSAVVCLSDPTRRYFRHDLWPEYKSGGRPSPEILPAVLATLATEFPSRHLPGLEADDVLGILATCGGGMSSHRRIVVGRDGDLMGIPGEHFNPWDGVRCTVTERQAERHHFIKTLTGEPSGDGYPGLRGCGPVRAERIIPPLPAADANPHAWRCACWEAICGAFRAGGHPEPAALLQARLSRILWACDYDIASRTVRLWTPPVPASLPGIPGGEPKLGIL